jgi:hypothetical protein
MAQLAGRQDEFLATQALAATQQYAGQYRLAEATIRRAADQAARAKASDAQAGFLLEGATALGLAGLCESNEKAVQEAMSLDKSKQTQAIAALTAAVCGNSKLALPPALELSKKFPQDTLIQDVYAPLSKAFVALAAGHAQEAAASAKKAYEAGFVIWKDADADLPMLMKAKKEYAAL